MGCNFYTMKGKHIGKRSAAGHYCWDCGITLCKKGNAGIHYNEKYADRCPICKQVPIKEPVSASAIGRELGFNEHAFEAKTGVKSCSSFSWSTDFEYITDKKFKDEYGIVYTRKEFADMLKECPIQFFNSIGEIFS